MNTSRTAFSPFARIGGPRPALLAPSTVVDRPAATVATVASARATPMDGASPVRAHRAFGRFGGVAGSGPRPASAVAAPSPEPHHPPEPEPDPYEADGFSRFEGASRPSHVSRDAWSDVFPPDRERVRTLAGRAFLSGTRPDEAVRMAAVRVRDERWLSGRCATRLAVLAPALGAKASDVPPAPHVAVACDAVGATARDHWRALSRAVDPARAAWPIRAWRAEPGFCIVCGSAADASEKRFGHANGGSDAVHAGCRDGLAGAARAFGELVAERCREIALDPDLTAPETVPEEDPPEDHDDWDPGPEALARIAAWFPRP